MSPTPLAFRPKRSVERIVAEVDAIHWWIDEQIAKSRTDDEIIAMAPTAIAFINGDLGLSELRAAIALLSKRPPDEG